MTNEFVVGRIEKTGRIKGPPNKWPMMEEIIGHQTRPLTKEESLFKGVFQTNFGWLSCMVFLCLQVASIGFLRAPMEAPQRV